MQLTAVGAGPGGEPACTRQAPTALYASTSSAFGGFDGGVAVATGDINGDGTSDVIVGTATGSSHVKVFDGATGAELFSFLAFDGFLGGIRVASGDVNNDGFTDIIVGTAVAAITPRCSTEPLAAWSRASSPSPASPAVSTSAVATSTATDLLTSLWERQRVPRRSPSSTGRAVLQSFRSKRSPALPVE